MVNSAGLIGLSVTVIVIFIIIPLIIAGISLLIYRASYKRKINKRLAEGKDADIKPMMSPLKFIVVMVSLVIGIIILLWGAVMVYFGIKATKQKNEMIVYPSVQFYRDNILEDSLFAGYKFGDEINGYNRFSKQYGDVKLEIYVTKYSFDVFPSILVAADYVGDKQDVFFSEVVKYSFSNETWGNDKCPDSLMAIDVGGFKGKIKFSHNVYYDSDQEHFLNEVPDESYEFDFRIHESGSIDCPQLGLTVDSWD